MYDKCESCGKWIADASDCKLFSNDGITIHTYCKKCHENRVSNKRL